MIHLRRLAVGLAIMSIVIVSAAVVLLIGWVANAIYTANPSIVKPVALVLLLLFFAYWLGRIYEYQYPDDFNRGWHRKVTPPQASDD